jgi:hypothetical protein
MILTFRRSAGLLHASCDQPIDPAVLAAAATNRLVEARMNGKAEARFKAELVTFKESTEQILEIGDMVT